MNAIQARMCSVSILLQNQHDFLHMHALKSYSFCLTLKSPRLDESSLILPRGYKNTPLILELKSGSYLTTVRRVEFTLCVPFGGNDRRNMCEMLSATDGLRVACTHNKAFFQMQILA